MIKTNRIIVEEYDNGASYYMFNVKTEKKVMNIKKENLTETLADMMGGE